MGFGSTGSNAQATARVPGPEVLDVAQRGVVLAGPKTSERSKGRLPRGSRNEF